MVYAIGGDGTLLSLLRSLYEHYSKVELPPIAAFNLVSFKFNLKNILIITLFILGLTWIPL